MWNRVEIGDCRQVLSGLPAGSFQCCVTSPPYWGLRDYGHPDQLGLEKTPDEYMTNMVGVFREVRRVLHDDGVLWLNLGDSYGTGASGQNFDPASGATNRGGQGQAGAFGHKKRPPLKGFHKNLVGIPWRVAFALQADGWFLRSDVIWSKPNPMPESVTDRPTKAHEYIFLLSKSERYFYDSHAIAEPLADANAQRTTAHYNTAERYGADNGGNSGLDALAARMRSGEHLSRNRRTVWTIATQPYSGAHFATMPPKLVERCILAGSKIGDVILDPFLGSGTVGEVAESLGRQWFGCELNPKYASLIKERTAQVGLFGKAK